MGASFNVKEVNRDAAACRCGCGFDVMDYELVMVLKGLAEHFGMDTLSINSWCRCKKHNAAVGGARRSQHLLGKAADVVVPSVPPSEVHAYLIDTYPDKYGIGRYRTFAHIDVRSKMARWGT